jgi:hypothetical protein
MAAIVLDFKPLSKWEINFAMLKEAIGVWIVCFCFIQSMGQLVSETKLPNSFSLSNAVIYVDENDFPLVKRSAKLLQQDIEMITGKKPELVNKFPVSPSAIVIGSLQKSSGISALFKQKKIRTDNVVNKWEAYLIQTFPNTLVIAGNDRRGVAYGVFEFSKQLGVSPWYWWADVPVKKKKEIFIKSNMSFTDAPKVKYRGIFINDEAPALSGWTKEKFGGFNHKFYEKVFELILRLKGNYLWPAMWGNAFYYDDSLNIRSADEYGIVIGTSHHEPLMRAHEEWKYFGKGRKWNYDSTEAGLREFWKAGMQRAWNEKVVSVGMRGDGDEPMSRETATALLERIVKDQRQIIAEVTGKPASGTPQLWALYKEVQDYYDKGMRVPDDVTLLLCDDNWGNIRKLPKLTDPPRKGGYGIYYHFDYVGGPRNYKWINTNNIARVWEQMQLAYEYGVKQIWIVNVGDIKPMEFPISFFLDYAWDPDKWNEDNLREYYTKWAAGQFGQPYAKEIGELLRKYSQYSSRRKPEMLNADTYQLSDMQYDNELGRVINEWNELLVGAEKMNNSLPAEFKDAFFQLVLHPVKAFANLHQLYGAVAYNRFYFKLNWPDANRWADYAKKCYVDDSLITIQYHQIANGKWNHMMDQTHIGYTYWQQPPKQKMPEIKYVPQDAQQLPPGLELATYSSKDSIPENRTGNIYYEKDGVVSIKAANWTKAINSKNTKWKVIPDIGRDGAGVTIFPVTTSGEKPAANNSRLEYEVYTYSQDSLKINAYFSPTLNYHNTDEGLQYAIAIDEEAPQIISINKEDRNTGGGIWNKWVGENIIIKISMHKIAKPGRHIVKYWMVNPGVILQKLVLDLGGLEPSYLGPPETRVK